MSNRKAGQNIGNNCFQTLRQQAEQNWDSCEIRWGKSSNCSPSCREEEESKWSTAVWKDQRDRDWSSSCWALGVLQDRAQWGRYAEKALQESIQSLLLRAKSALSEATLCACSVATSSPALWEAMNLVFSLSPHRDLQHTLFLVQWEEKRIITQSYYE